MGASVLAVTANVSNDQQVNVTLAEVERKFGCTRFAPNFDLRALNEEDSEQTFGVKVNGTLLLFEGCGSHVANRWIVSVASVAAFNDRGSSIAYTPSEGALISLTKFLVPVLALEVTVNAVGPE